jgi:predicted dinucleotide-binding enzyme
MNIGVLGTGMVGRALAGRLAALGHAVLMGSRQPQQALSAHQELSDWLAATPQVKLATFAEAAAHGELLINATNGNGSLAALEMAGAEHLRGKVLIDVSNPLDFSHGMPPSLFVCNTDSLAEHIQRAFPDVRVVKSLNTMNASLMVQPEQLAGGEHTVFMSGNDPTAKAQVRQLLESFGWHDILDLGDLSTARGAEMILPIWLSAWGAVGSPMFQFKIVR